VIQPSKTKWEY